MSASGITPLLRYRDPHQAAEWLCRAFGFTINTTEHEPDGSLRCITLDAGRGLIVIGPVVSDTELDRLMAQPTDIGGISTQTCYATVDDVATHCQTARAAGASIAIEPTVDEGGTAYYLCRDPEGHLWSFGTHSFNTESAAAGDTHPIALRPQPIDVDTDPAPAFGRRIGAVAAVTAALIAGSVIVYASSDFASPKDTAQNAALKQAFISLRTESQQERQKRLAAEKATEEAASRHAEAVRIGETLKSKLSDAKSALQFLRQRNSEIEHSLRTTEAQSFKVLGERDSQLTKARTKIAALDQARTGAVASAKAAAEKLRSADQLNRQLHDKLDKAQNTIAAVRDKNQQLESALVDSRASYDKRLKAALDQAQVSHDKKLADNHKRLTFASAELAKAASQLSDERRRTKVAVDQLAQTIAKLDQARAKAGKLAQRVRWLETELRDSYANMRMRFLAFRSNDVELALATVPEIVLKPRHRVTAVERAEPSPLPTRNPNKRAKKPTKKRDKLAKQRSKLAKKQDKMPEKKAEQLAKKPDKADEADNQDGAPDNLKLATTCARAVWSAALRGRARSDRSKSSIINRLCANAPNSAEPARCFQAVMGGRVNWGRGTRWAVQNAINLCAGTLSANSTIGCFKASVANSGWRQAVSQCRSG